MSLPLFCNNTVLTAHQKHHHTRSSHSLDQGNLVIQRLCPVDTCAPSTRSEADQGTDDRQTLCPVGLPARSFTLSKQAKSLEGTQSTLVRSSHAGLEVDGRSNTAETGRSDTAETRDRIRRKLAIGHGGRRRIAAGDRGGGWALQAYHIRLSAVHGRLDLGLGILSDAAED
ncbi:hypothetical protein BDY17DRAFT_305895, partial [Neohortaea acidophila]